jgi:hypothetical protein
MNKAEIAALLYELSALMDLKGDVYKRNAYRKAAQSIEALDAEVSKYRVQGKLETIPGVGKAIAQKITEMLDTGRLHKLEELRAEFPPGEWGKDALERRVAAFEGAERAVVRRAAPPKKRNGKRQQNVAARPRREIDLKLIVTHLAVEGPGRVAFSLRADPSGSAKPAEVLAAIFGDGAPPRGVKVLKEGVSLARTTRPGTQRPPRAPRYLDA